MRVAVALTAVLLSGCYAFQPQTFTVHKAVETELLARYTRPLDKWREPYDLALTGRERRDARNRILDELVWLINEQFATYETDLCASRTGVDTAGDIIELGLTGAAAATGSLAAATVLSAIATGVGGARAVVARNYFAEQSCFALAVKMRTLRLEARLPIEEGERKSAVAYPLERGMIDLQAYLEAGTLRRALQDVMQQLSGQEQHARAVLQALPPRDAEALPPQGGPVAAH